MKDRHICWTCKRVGMGECSWDKCGEPVEGWVAIEHKFPNEKYDSYTVIECPLHIYDGECVGCVRNENHIAECLYDSCSYFNKQKAGACACEQWAIVNQGHIWNDEQANKHGHYERVMTRLRRR